MARFAEIPDRPVLLGCMAAQAGYETDADESELSEWESGSVRQGFAAKRVWPDSGHK